MAQKHPVPRGPIEAGKKMYELYKSGKKREKEIDEASAKARADKKRLNNVAKGKHPKAR